MPSRKFECLRVDGETHLDLLTASHAEELFKLVDKNRSHLEPWMPWVHNTRDIPEISAFIAANGIRYEAGQAVVVGIWQDVDSLAAQETSLRGVASLHAIDRLHSQCAVGYWLCVDAQGQGLMRRVVRRLCDYGFSDLQLHRIEIRCATENHRSQSVALGCGFMHEGTLRQAQEIQGQFMDLEMYGLLQGELPPESNSEIPLG